jgi:hypothetical protein
MTGENVKETLATVVAILEETGVPYVVITPEDFVLQKLNAGRPRDFDDAIPFTFHREKLDHAYLNDWARRLGVREELD